MPSDDILRVTIRAEFDHESWWRLDWALYFFWTMKAARPKGLPLLRVSM